MLKGEIVGPLRVAALPLVALLALAVPTSAAAKPGKISGKLNKRGYTVIALAASGAGESKRAPKGKFKLRPPAKKATLQLRAPDGTYAGPVVLAKQKNGKRAIVGVKAKGKVKLGKVKLNRGKGYAKLKRRAAKKLKKRGQLNKTWQAKAKKGVPIGAGSFGHVKSKPPKKWPAGDYDFDGVPDPLDVDDDGDLIIDNLDPTASSSSDPSARAAIAPGTYGVGASSLMPLELYRTVNANVPGITDAQVEAALPQFGFVGIGSITSPGGLLRPDRPPEIDCGDPDTGLAYCRKNNSTGQKVGLYDTSQLSGEPFPSCCDDDGDGFGTLENIGFLAPLVIYGVTLHHGATSAQIGTGDVVIERAKVGGEEMAFPGVLNFVFNTTPALLSVSDDAGHTYSPSYPGDPGDPGNAGNGFGVADGPDPDPDVQLTFTFWRPQRKAISPETGEWIDLGHLTYNARAVNTQGSRPKLSNACPESAYSESDPNLNPFFPDGDPEVDQYRSGLRDSADDQPADAANTLTFTLDLSKCPLEDYGAGWGIGLGAVPANTYPPPSRPDNASTIVFFKPL